MPEPMVANAPDTNWWPLSRQRGLRRRYGPDNPLTPLLSAGGLLVSDIYVFVFEFDTAYVAAQPWTKGTSGGGGAPDSGLTANVPNGTWDFTTGTTDDASERLFQTNSERWTASRRPIAITRLGTNAAVTSSKWEFGFANADQAGQVLVKSTPTSTGADYAVVIRDTDHNTSTDLVTDGTVDAVQRTVSSPGITFATQTWYDVMLAGNEQKEWRFYIDGVFQGRATRGPDITTTLGLYFMAQNRDDADTAQLRVDFVRAWQERVPFGSNAFTT